MSESERFIRLQGGTYDAQVLEAPHIMLLTRAETPSVRGTPEAMGVLMVRNHYEQIINRWSTGVHELFLHTIDDEREISVCCCALVVPRGLNILRTSGHLDMRTWKRTPTYVAREGAGSGVLHAVCERCGWSNPVDLGEAQAVIEAHDCSPTTPEATQLPAEETMHKLVEETGIVIAEGPPPPGSPLARLDELCRRHEVGELTKAELEDAAVRLLREEDRSSDK